MLLSSTLLFGVAQLFTAVHARNLKVTVGANNSLTFSPSTIRAFPGDTVEFIFAGLNHTVTSGNPFLGCQPDGLINSGFVPVAAPATGKKLAIRGANNVFNERDDAYQLPEPSFGDSSAGVLPSFKVPIFDFRPRTLYCAQSLHCQNGMVMVINPTKRGPTSLARYQSLSAQADANVAPPAVVGGFLRNAPGATAGWQVVRKNAVPPTS